MAKWDAALNTEKLIKRSSLEQMFMPAKLADGKTVMRFTHDKISIIVNSNGKSGADRIGYAEVLAKTVADA